MQVSRLRAGKALPQFLSSRLIPLTLSGLAILTLGRMHGQTIDDTLDRLTQQTQFAATASGTSPGSIEEQSGHGTDSGWPGPAVSLSWKASTSRHVVGYNIYRRTSFGEREKLNREPIRSTHFVDYFVVPGFTYRYHVRAVDWRGRESNASNKAVVFVPFGG